MNFQRGRGNDEPEINLIPLIDVLFRPLERDHCRKSFESEQRGAHLPAAYRESR